MYTIVMAMALSGSADIPEFGRRSCCSCRGGCSCSCSGGRRSRCCGCCGGYMGCSGSYGCSGGYGCTGGYQNPQQQPREPVPAPKKSTQEQVRSTITVSLPAEARLTIDGQATNSTSTNRVFVTPPLRAGEQYEYQLRAEINRNGTPVDMTRTVTFRGGENARVSFDFATAETTANP